MSKRLAVIAACTTLLVSIAAAPAMAQTRISVSIGRPIHRVPVAPVAVVPAPPYPGYVWQPAHYEWTPYGYQLVPGAWLPAPYVAPPAAYVAPVRVAPRYVAPRYVAPVYVARRPAPRVAIGVHINTGHGRHR